MYYFFGRAMWLGACTMRLEPEDVHYFEMYNNMPQENLSDVVVPDGIEKIEWYY